MVTYYAFEKSAGEISDPVSVIIDKVDKAAKSNVKHFITKII